MSVAAPTRTLKQRIYRYIRHVFYHYEDLMPAHHILPRNATRYRKVSPAEQPNLSVPTYTNPNQVFDLSYFSRNSRAHPNYVAPTLKYFDGTPFYKEFKGKDASTYASPVSVEGMPIAPGKRVEWVTVPEAKQDVKVPEW